MIVRLAGLALTPLAPDAAFVATPGADGAEAILRAFADLLEGYAAS